MGTIRKPDTPEKAIRLKCLECCCGAATEVENCNLSGCPLFEYRMYGAKPAEKKQQTAGDLVVETDSSKIAVSGENAKLEVVVKKDSVVKDGNMFVVDLDKVERNTSDETAPKKKRQSRKKTEVSIEVESVKKHEPVIELEEVEIKQPDEIIDPISKVDTGTGTICGEPVVVAETVDPEKSEDDDIDLDLDIDDEPKEIEAEPEKKETDSVPDVSMSEIDLDGTGIDDIKSKKKESKKKAEPVKEQNEIDLDDIDVDDIFDW